MWLPEEALAGGQRPATLSQSNNILLRSVQYINL
jgi:hypothetical protein